MAKIYRTLEVEIGGGKEGVSKVRGDSARCHLRRVLNDDETRRRTDGGGTDISGTSRGVVFCTSAGEARSWPPAVVEGGEWKKGK